MHVHIHVCEWMFLSDLIHWPSNLVVVGSVGQSSLVPHHWMTICLKPFQVSFLFASCSPSMCVLLFS